ncbi:hypothetical protein [Haloferula helveola]|uniref:hypothetical protein n=1 Tax=Haloferula helveola TaxID=490095 RepID=UPI0030D02FFE
MSRRSRKRRGKPASKGSWWLRAVIVLLVLAVVAMGGGYLWLRSWLHSEDFRTMLSAEVGKALGAEAEFGTFRWEGTTVDTKSFDASGGAVVGEVDARGLSMNIGLDRVGERVLELQTARINEIKVRLDLRDKPDAGRQEPVPPPVTPSAPKEPKWYDRWVPNEFELTGLDVGRSSVELILGDGPIEFSGTAWSVEPGRSSGSYEAIGSGGEIRFPWEFVPELRLNEARLRYQDSTVFLTESDFRVYERGYATLVGEASVGGSGGYAFTGTLTDVMADEVVTEDWRQRIEGKVESDFSVVGKENGPSVSGRVRLLDGVLTGLPVLDSLGAYGGNPRFRRLALSEASADFHWEDGSLLLTDIKIGSEGLMRVEGLLRVEKDDRIDGRFRVGLTPGTLARIPGAETKVFLPGERGLLWAPLHVTGTLDDPEEDLTDRLIAAAGLRMFEVLPETGERVLKYTERVMSEDVADRIAGTGGVIEQGTDLIDRGRGLLDGEGDVLDEAEDVIRRGTDVVGEVGGLLDVIRGKDKEKPAPRTPPESPREPE